MITEKELKKMIEANYPILLAFGLHDKDITMKEYIQKCIEHARKRKKLSSPNKI